MAITNLINTTWVFKDGPLDFSYFDDLAQKFVPIDFISNTASYKFFAVRSPSTDLYNIGYSPVAPTQVNIVYSQNDSTGVFNWSDTAFQTIQITGGEAVRFSPLINFLSNNATCTQLVTVTFNTNGKGDAVSSQTFASGRKANMIIPFDDDYIFAGWYTDSDLTTRFDFDTNIDADITLYAKWIPKAIKTNISGTWNSGTPLVKVNNTWKNIDKLFVKANWHWEPVIYNVPPTPVVSTFKIGNITYTFEEGMTWNDWVLSSKYSKSTSGMNIPSSPTSAGFHGELSSSVEITDNSEAYKSGAGYVCVGWGDSNEEAYWDLLVYSPDIYSLIRKVRSWETISPNQEYFIKWA